ncbi:MAG TPA: cation:dicarboxylase symporter family transporter, partial [Cellvibrionaceae bacterium]
MNLTARILLAMCLGIAVGLAINLLTPASAEPGTGWIQVYLVLGVFDTIGQIFVASLKLLVVPLVFVSLVCGTASLGNQARMGALAGKTVSLYLATTGIAITLAIAIASLIKPGVGMNLEAPADTQASVSVSLKETIVNIFPDNPVAAMADGNLLQVIVFSILFGIAISSSGDAAAALLNFFN